MNLPLTIVLARSLATIPVCALLAASTPQADWAALGLFAVAATSDLLDGWLARARGEVTALGTVLDPLADKVLVVGTLGALVLRGLAPPWALAVLIARELAAVWARAVSRTPLPSTADGKAKTVLQVVACATLTLAAATRTPEVAAAGSALLAAAVALSILSGLRLLLRAAKTTTHAA